MANLNKVMLIGRLTRDPEMRTFANGGKVANLGFAVNNKKKNQATGAWEDDAVFVDVKAFNRETGRKLADLCEQYLHKGNLAYIEGHLVLDQWTSQQDGQKQSKLRIVMDDVQFLTPKGDGGGGMSGGPRQPSSFAASPSQSAVGAGYQEEPPAPMDGGPGPEGEEIPF